MHRRGLERTFGQETCEAEACWQVNSPTESGVKGGRQDILPSPLNTILLRRARFFVGCAKRSHMYRKLLTSAPH